MSTEISTKQTIPPEKYGLVKEQFAKGCTESEFQVFLELANRYQLDPFARQIWAVKGYDSASAKIMIARDGYLAVAHRSGQFDGMSDPEYETDEKGTVIHVRVRVYRKDMSHPFTGDAWNAEDNLHQNVWNKRQRTMLLKVAESRALRKAFSISGTYCPEELGFDDTASYKIDPKPGDITVENIRPAIQPAKEPVKNAACNTVTVEEVQFRYLPVYQRQHLKLDVFTDADLGNGKYNKDMIDEDYRRQQGIKKPADPAGEPSAQPAEVVGNAEENLKANAEREDALKNLLNASKNAASSRQTNPEPAPKQTKPSVKLTEYVCEVCGCRLTEFDIHTCNLFTAGHMLCEIHRTAYLKNKSGDSK